MTAPEAVYAGYLAQHRERINAQVAGLLHRARRVSHDDVRDVLRGVLAPIYEALHTADDTRADSTMRIVDEVAFDLVARGLLGPHVNETAARRSVREAWAVLVPAVPYVLHDAPRNVCVAITHAVLQLSETLSDRHARAWTNRMLAAADVLEARPGLSQPWLSAGQVAAWRSGMAHYRHGALVVLRTLEPTIASAALSLPAADIDADALAAHPFATLGPQQPLRRRIGGFSGYLRTGSEPRPGIFDAPPLLGHAAGQLYAIDGKRAYSVFVDSFGHTFRADDQKRRTTDTVKTPHFVATVNGDSHFIEIEILPPQPRGRRK